MALGNAFPNTVNMRKMSKCSFQNGACCHGKYKVRNETLGEMLFSLIQSKPIDLKDV